MIKGKLSIFFILIIAAGSFGLVPYLDKIYINCFL